MLGPVMPGVRRTLGRLRRAVMPRLGPTPHRARVTAHSTSARMRDRRGHADAVLSAGLLSTGLRFDGAESAAARQSPQQIETGLCSHGASTGAVCVFVRFGFPCAILLAARDADGAIASLVSMATCAQTDVLCGRGLCIGGLCSCRAAMMRRACACMRSALTAQSASRLASRLGNSEPRKKTFVLPMQ